MIPSVISSFFPAFSGYSRAALRGDVISGLTVGVILVPQGMAYAVLAGIPAAYGLYAGLVPLLVYGLLGTGRHVAFGIVAVDCLIIAAAVTRLAAPGSPEYISLVLLLTLLVGIFQLLLGMLRIGFVVNLLSRPVLAGFVSAAAIIVVLSQVKGLMGLPVPMQTSAVELFRTAAAAALAFNGPTFAIGAGSLVLLVLLRRFFPRVPGPLVAVMVTGLLVWFLSLEGRGVETVGQVPPGVPRPHVPAVSLESVRALLPTVATLSLIQFINTISIGKLFASRFGYRISANREFVAVGLANTIGSLFLAPPSSSSYSRSAVAAASGSVTALSNVMAACVVLVSILLLTPLLTHLPIAAFSAIIIVSVATLIDVRELRFLWRTKRADGLIALITFVVTLIVGIQQGILTGIALSILAVVARKSRPNISVLGLIPGTHTFKELEHDVDARPLPDILALRMDASFTFINAERLRDAILDLTASTPCRAIIIDAQPINDMDTTALAVLSELHDSLASRHIAFVFGGVKPPVMDLFRQSGLIREFGDTCFFMSPYQAAENLMHMWGRELSVVS
ncbi:MAG: sodium-independent anion transporter [Bacteroidetes bacterium CG12_big_fil_rev_8_21_14_0_65_60_17]|nr:MAG: sodium-independent anion transporter [Bacteroidetes bacterium CG12_big_fil_rev_8_21_14_0_65_60_17]